MFLCKSLENFFYLCFFSQGYTQAQTKIDYLNIYFTQITSHTIL